MCNHAPEFTVYSPRSFTSAKLFAQLDVFIKTKYKSIKMMSTSRKFGGFLFENAFL